LRGLCWLSVGRVQKIGIVGCRVAGQAAATFLSEAGHDVTL
jgi:glycine/D-amino acid oxidase-like deaminating enzyme